MSKRDIPVTVTEMPKPGSVLNWSVREYIGVEVLTAPPGLTREEVLALTPWPEEFKPEPIRTEDGIQEGSVVLIPGLMGGLGVFTIERMEDGSLCGMGGDRFATLEWDTDDRHCWVCGGTANLKAIQRLEITR
jgi:hypothetical protein